MPPREWKIRLEDILESIDRIARYTEGLDEAAFQHDEKTVDAVIRNMAVIGEAARFVPPDIEEKHAEVPWTKMRGLRNVVIHEYFGVSLEILWETAKTDLPALKPLLERILAETT